MHFLGMVLVSSYIIGFERIEMHVASQSPDEPKVVYVERQPSAWAWFTPLRTILIVLAIAIVAFLAVDIAISANKTEHANQRIEQLEQEQANDLVSRV